MPGVQTIRVPPDILDRETDRKFSAAEPASCVRRITDVVPWVRVGPDELRSLPLGHLEGFVLSLIDGTLTLEEVLDLSGMNRKETLSLLRNLLIHGAIEVRDPANDDRFCASEILSINRTL